MENELKYSSFLSIRAEKELKDSFVWYEEQRKGLGSSFIAEVTYLIRKIEEYPELFSIKYKSYREVGMKTFPYVVIYRLNKRKSIVRVVSVFHTAQNPNRKYQ